MSDNIRLNFTVDTSGANTNFERLTKRLNEAVTAFDALNQSTKNGAQGSERDLKARDALARKIRDLTKEISGLGQQQRASMQTMRDSTAVVDARNAAMRRSVTSTRDVVTAGRQEISNSVTKTKTLREAVAAYRDEQLRQQDVRKASQALIEEKRKLATATQHNTIQYRAQLASLQALVPAMKAVIREQAQQRLVRMTGNQSVGQLQGLFPAVANSRQFIVEAQNIEERIRQIATTSRATRTEIRTMIDDAAMGRQRRWRSELVQTRSQIVGQVDAYRKLSQATSTWAHKAVEATKAVDVSWRSYVRYFLTRLTYSTFMKLAQGMREGVKAASDLQLRIAEIRTISQDSGRSIRDWTYELRALSDAFPQSTLDIAEATYQALSNQVVNATTVTGFLTEALRLSIVTVATTAQSINALSSVINSYNLGAGAAAQVSAQFFKIVELGRVRLEEVADDFGNITAIAAQVGVEFAEVGAAMTTITRQGIRANTAMTLIRNVLLKLIQPTENMKTLFREWGVETAEQAIQTFGFIGVLEKLEDATRGSTTEISNLFSRIRATVGAAAIFSGDNLARFASDYRDILYNSAAAYDEATRRAFDAPARRAQIELQKLKNFFMVDIGSEMLGRMVEITEAMGGAVTMVTTLTKQVVALTASFVMFKAAQKAVIKSAVIFAGLKQVFITKEVIALNLHGAASLKAVGAALFTLKGAGIAAAAAFKLLLPALLAAAAAYGVWHVAMKKVNQVQADLEKQSARRLLHELIAAREAVVAFEEREQAALRYYETVTTGSRRVAQAIADERKGLFALGEAAQEALAGSGGAFETAFTALERSAQQADNTLESVISSIESRTKDVEFELFSERTDSTNRFLSITQNKLGAIQQTVRAFEQKGLSIYDADNLEDARRYYGEAISRQKQLRDEMLKTAEESPFNAQARRNFETAQQRYLGMLNKQLEIEQSISEEVKKRQEQQEADRERITRENQQIGDAFRAGRETTFEGRIQDDLPTQLSRNQDLLDARVVELRKAQNLLFTRGNFVEANLLGNFVTDLQSSFEQFARSATLEGLDKERQNIVNTLENNLRTIENEVEGTASSIQGQIVNAAALIKGLAPLAGEITPTLEQISDSLSALNEGELGVRATLGGGEAVNKLMALRDDLERLEASLLTRGETLVRKNYGAAMPSDSATLIRIGARAEEGTPFAELRESLEAINQTRSALDGLVSDTLRFDVLSERMQAVASSGQDVTAVWGHFAELLSENNFGVGAVKQVEAFRDLATVSSQAVAQYRTELENTAPLVAKLLQTPEDILRAAQSRTEFGDGQFSAEEARAALSATQVALAEMAERARQYGAALAEADKNSPDYTDLKARAEAYYTGTEGRLEDLSRITAAVVADGHAANEELMASILNGTRLTIQGLAETLKTGVGQTTKELSQNVTGGLNVAFDGTADVIRNNVTTAMSDFRTYQLLPAILDAQTLAKEIAGIEGATLGTTRGTAVINRNSGGIIPGTGYRDSVPAMLTPGEFVINKAATATFLPMLEALNAGRLGKSTTNSSSSTNVTINVNGNNVTGDTGVSPDTARQVAELIRNDMNVGRMRRL